MSPADLSRLLESLDTGEEMEAAGLTVWKVGDAIKQDGIPIILDEIIVVQDPESKRHGRVVFIGHDKRPPGDTISGSFPILFPAAMAPKKG